MANINPDPLAVEIFMRAMARAVLDLDENHEEEVTTERFLLRLDDYIAQEKSRKTLQGLDPGRETWDLRESFSDMLRTLRESEC